jgi:AcrR family transcriptional regulator
VVSEYLLTEPGDQALRPLGKKISPANGAGVNGARMAGEERRLQILRVAMRLFSQRGFRGTTTKEIALAAGVSEAMVFRHFATKEALYSAILDHKACLHDAMDPQRIVGEAIKRKDDRAVFEGIALDALKQHDCDPEFQRLLLHSALEEHELAQMFWEKFVRRVYRSLGDYIRERQHDGAIVDVEPAIIVRAFIGMMIHHSLNNNLWDRKRRLLNISNETAAREFTDILLHGVGRRGRSDGRPSLGKFAPAQRTADVTKVLARGATKRRHSASIKTEGNNSRRKKSRK